MAYPFICWWTQGLLPLLGSCELCRSEHESTNICLSLCFYFFGYTHTQTWNGWVPWRCHVWPPENPPPISHSSCTASHPHLQGTRFPPPPLACSRLFSYFSDDSHLTACEAASPDGSMCIHPPDDSLLTLSILLRVC